ncbi:uncharacterized protein [Dermacentor andersoni]|uniref:uncharacterized protein n=1 Tax=Dermacentor andersoni TaxID=34620 RepID=UPI002155B8AE|nr:uncharacterized protein LOC126530138 [Dermacentor andersoni]
MARDRPSSSRTSPAVAEPATRAVTRVPLHSRRQIAALAGRSILPRRAGAVGNTYRFSAVKAAVRRFLKDPIGQPLPKPVENCLTARFKKILRAYATLVAEELRFLQLVQDLEERLAAAGRELGILQERLAQAESHWFSQWWSPRAGDYARGPGC